MEPSPGIVVVDAAPPGVVKRAFFCDESGISGDLKHYGFGALVMGYQRRGEFAAAMARIREEHGRPDEEIKWNKCSRSNAAFYRALVDYFFATSGLAFHCIVVERAWVNTQLYHNGSYDLARRKHFTQFLSNKVAAIARVNPGRQLWTRVYVDKIASSYEKAGEAVEIIGNRTVSKAVSLSSLAQSLKPIDNVIECDSKKYNGIQLSDLLLGAVIDTWNNRSTSDHKTSLKRHIAGYLGWRDLKSDTTPDQRKFNVWWLTDQINPGQQRPVVTRAVRLVHPLPPVRVYARRS